MALIYAEAGVPEYRIVCPEEKRVKIHRQPGLQGYAVGNFAFLWKESGQTVSCFQ